MNCPCGTEKAFEECCGPFLSGEKFPATAEQLMRSRYTAVTRSEIEYLERTTAPEEKSDFSIDETRKWADENRWKGLKIIDTDRGGPSDETGTVEFRATYEKDGQGIDHHEVSQFRKNNKGRWMFIDGESHTHKEGEEHHHHEPHAPIIRNSPKIGRNDPCHCGSGKKYKKCCGSS